MTSFVSYRIADQLSQTGTAAPSPSHLATADFIRQLTRPRPAQVNETLPLLSLPDALPDALLTEAKTGDFRAIACWLNVYLLPQGISAWVGEACPAYLQITVTVRRPPHRDRLIRFICHQLCRLDSDVIRGAHLAVRLADTSFILWQQLIQLPTAEPPSPPPLTQITESPVVASVRTTLQATRESVLQQIQGLRDGRSFRLMRLPRVAPPPAPSLAWVPQTTPRLNRQVNRPKLVPIGGAAIAVLVLGSGLQLFIHHRTHSDGNAAPPNTADRGAWAQIYDGQAPLETLNQVQTSVGTVPVTPLYPLPAATRDGAITLLFSHPAAIATRSGDGLHAPGRRTTVRFQREVLQRAEVTMTALDTELHLDNEQTAPNSDAIATLRRQGVDVVNAAQPPLAETEPEVLHDMLQALHQQTIHTAGAGNSPQQNRRPKVLEVGGTRIAYLGYVDADPANPLADKNLNVGTQRRLAADIRAIRDQVDWVIVNYQWQRAIAPQPDQAQINLARFAVDQGADLVVGHHPTVMQGAEVYKGRAIAYSLGRLPVPSGPIDSAAALAAAVHGLDTALLQVELQETEMRVELVPIQVREGEAAIATEESAQTILKTIEAASENLPTPLASPTVLKIHPAQREFPFTPPSLGPEAPTEPPDDSFISSQPLQKTKRLRTPNPQTLEFIVDDSDQLPVVELAH
ncbi:MAG: CapA family protein [Synechococcales bacterium]|nr:CapA family protein [Synechococcales bacterium]